MSLGVPSHKVIPGCGFTVDAFRTPQPWVKAYFLTHAHSDHYTGLNEHWCAGPIWCSAITADLAVLLTGVGRAWLRPLPLDTPTLVEGVQVTLIDANHCPGAVQVLFQLPDNGPTYLHCGDMRFTPSLLANPALVPARGCEGVFLDTTYCNPRHTFPPQEAAVEYVAATICGGLEADRTGQGQGQGQLEGRQDPPGDEEAAMQEEEEGGDAEDSTALAAAAAAAGSVPQDHEQLVLTPPDPASSTQPPPTAAAGSSAAAGGSAWRVLYVISTYVIGKERLLLEVARRSGVALGVTPQKLEVLRATGLSPEQLAACFTTDASSTPLRVVPWGTLGDTWPYFRPNFTALEELRVTAGAQRVVAFCPTGWLYEMKKATFPVRTKGPLSIHLVPYSEHSSYSELLEYVSWLKPKRVIPTVGVSGSGESYEKQRDAICKHFRHLVDAQAGKAAFIARLSGSGGSRGRVCGGLSRRSSSGGGSGTAGREEMVDGDALPAAAAAGGSNGGVAPRLTRSSSGSGSKRARESDDQLPQQQQQQQGKEQQAGNGAVLGEGTAHAPTTPGSSRKCAKVEGAGSSPAGGRLERGMMSAAAAAAAEGDADLGFWGCVGDEPTLQQQEAAEGVMTAVHEPSRPPTPAADIGGTQLVSPQSTSSDLPPSVAAAAQQVWSILAGQVTPQEASLLAVAAQGDVGAALTAWFDQAGTAGTMAGGVTGGSGGVLPAAASEQVQKAVQVLQQQMRVPASAPAAAARSAPVTAGVAAAGPQQGGVNADQKHQQPAQQRRGTSSSRTKAAASGTSAGSAGSSGRKARGSTGSTKAAMAAAAGGAKQSSITAFIGGSQAAAAAAGGSRRSPAPAVSAAAAGPGQSGVNPIVIDLDQEAGFDQQVVDCIAAPSTSTAAAAAAAAGAVGRQTVQAALSPPAEALAVAPVQTPGEELGHTRSPAAEVTPATAAAAAAAGTHKPRPQAADVAQHGIAAFFGARSKPPQQQQHQQQGVAGTAAASGIAAGSSTAAPAGTGAPPLTMFDRSTAAGPAITQAIRDAPLLPLAKYDPVKHACWSTGQPAPYLHLALTFAAVDGTTKRLVMGDALTNMFRSVVVLSPGDLEAAAYLACGKLAPEFAGVDLNLGTSTVATALREVTGVGRGALRELYRGHGDLGDVAAACRGSAQSTLKRPSPLTLTGVFSSLHDIARQAGAGAAGRRQAIVAGLLRRCRDSEIKYLVRTLVQNLRVGAGWRSVLGPLAKAVAIERQGVRPSNKTALAAAAKAATDAYHVCPDLGLLVKTLVEFGPEELVTRCGFTPGVPVKPMLAKPCEGVGDGAGQLVALALAAGPEAGGAAAAVPTPQAVIQQGDATHHEQEHPTAGLSPPAATAAAGGASSSTAAAAPPSCVSVLVEWKYDGQRAQVHVLPGGQVRIFTRNCQDTTPSFPDVVAALQDVVPPAAVPLVLDAELVAVQRSTPDEVDPGPAPAEGGLQEDGGSKQQQQQQVPLQLLAFQELATRARSEVDSAAAVKVEVCVFAFDLLCVAGRSLMGVSLRDRRRLLADIVLPGQQQGSSTDHSNGSTDHPSGSSTGRCELVRLAESIEVQVPVAPYAAAAAAASKAKRGRKAPAASPKQQLSAAAAGPLASAVAEGDGSGGEEEEEEEEEEGVHVGPADMLQDDLDDKSDEADWQEQQQQQQQQQQVEGQQAGQVLADANQDMEGGPAAPDGGDVDDGDGAPEPSPGSVVAAAAAARSNLVNPEVAAEGVVFDYFLGAIGAGAEGLMLKLLDGPASGYRPSVRHQSWTKLKRDYLNGLADSLDLVVIGAWHGQGRKVSWYSPWLLAVYDPATDTYQSLCRCMSGFSDAFYAAATQRLGAQALPGRPANYVTGESPSLWFPPTEVWELRGADLSLSPVHQAAAGLLHPSRGLGLRFPRFMRTRPDKSPQEATPPGVLVDMYRRQTRRMGGSGAAAGAAAGGGS